MIRGGGIADAARAIVKEPLEPEPIGGLTWVLVAAALLPLAVALIRALTGSSSGFHATSDNAINELLVRDVGRHPILLGPYSRSEWSHPGPLFFYLSAIPYRLFGGRSSAMLATALLINGAAIGVTVAVAKRWGGLALALPVVLLNGLLITSLPLGFLQDPWNPFITVLPFGAFLMVAWAAACGDRWAFPVAAFIGSFCMQTHIGYASLVIAALAWCAWSAWRHRATDGLVGCWWALAVLGVVWSAPVFEQIIHDPGNIRTIVRYFRTTTEPTHSIADGARVIGAQFNLVPDWMVGLRDVNLFSGQPAGFISTPIPVLLIPFGVAIALAWRAHDRQARRFAAVLVISLGVGLVSLAQTVGSMYEYRLRWIWVLAGLCMAFTAAQAAQMFARRVPGNRVRLIIAACVTATIVLSAFGIARVTSYEPRDVGETTTLSALSAAVLRHLPDRPGVVLISARGFSSATYLPGLILVMERAGVRVKLENTPVKPRGFGDHRDYAREPLKARLQIESGAGIEAAAAGPDVHRIAYVSSISRARRARALREVSRLLARGVQRYEPRFVAVEKALVAVAVLSLPTPAGPNPAPNHKRP